jgi:hypothetical protein
MNIINEAYEVKDLAVAAYLYSTQQLEFAGIKRLPSREVYFRFLPGVEAEKLVQAYWNGSAPIIQPKQLFNAQRDLKDMIFAG